MLGEKIIFSILAFSLFIFIFFKMIRKNDTSYILILSIEAIGIAISFINILFGILGSTFFVILSYLLAVGVPLFIIYLEYKKINFMEVLSLIRSKIYIVLGDKDQAKKILINLVTKYPESYLGHKKLAEIYQRAEEISKAIGEYVKVIDLHTQDYDSYYKIAELLKQVDKQEEAITMLENLLRKKPDYNKATDLLGMLLCEKENYKEAITIYTNALKYNPESFEIYYNLGMVYTMLNDFQNAQISYEKAASINHQLYNCYYSLAEIALIYHDLEAAEKYFTESLYGEEVEAKSYFELAKIYMLKNEREKAIMFANKAIEIEPYQYKHKIEKEPIFITIMQHLNLSLVLEEKETKTLKLTPLEEKVQGHLEKTNEVVENLDIKGISKASQKIRKDSHKLEVEQEEKEKGQ